MKRLSIDKAKKVHGQAKEFKVISHHDYNDDEKFIGWGFFELLMTYETNYTPISILFDDSFFAIDNHKFEILVDVHSNLLLYC